MFHNAASNRYRNIFNNIQDLKEQCNYIIVDFINPLLKSTAQEVFLQIQSLVGKEKYLCKKLTGAETKKV